MTEQHHIPWQSQKFGSKKVPLAYTAGRQALSSAPQVDQGTRSDILVLDLWSKRITAWGITLDSQDVFIRLIQGTREVVPLTYLEEAIGGAVLDMSTSTTAQVAVVTDISFRLI